MSIRRTKIIATLGPATDVPEVLEAVIAAGADVLRINLSHGTPEEQERRAAMVREVAARLNKDVAILADLRGPKIRVRRFRGGSVTLRSGDPFTLDASGEPNEGDEKGVGISYEGLAADVEPGDVLLLDDGLLSMRVKRIRGTRIHCEVEIGGVLGDRKGISVKGGGVSLPGLADHDIRDIPRVARMDADYLAVSFARNAEDMEFARRLLREAGSAARLVAKIERTEAIDNLESIIAASDAVLIARGDLAVEIGDAELPGLQKLITRKSLEQNRIVITATQMMQSMVESPIPTRAEVLDVANSVFDGTDAVMLSAETAVGRHPDTVVEAMNRICLGAESSADTTLAVERLNVQFQRIDQAIAMAAMFMATHVSVQAIVALTESGSTAQWLSRVRSGVPIYALSRNVGSRRRMALYCGVHAITDVVRHDDVEEALAFAVRTLVKRGHIRPGNRIIMTMGEMAGEEGGTNSLRLAQVGQDGTLRNAHTIDV